MKICHICLLILITGCNKHLFNGEEKKGKPLNAQEESKLIEFAAKHSAKSPWINARPGMSEYTAVYQNALLKSKIENIAFMAYLKDVVVESGQAIFVFDVVDPGVMEVQLRLNSELNGNLYRSVVNGGNSYSLWCVAAKDLDPTLEKVDGFDTVVARGVCVAMEKK